MYCVDDAFDAKAAEGCAEKMKTYPEERNEKPDKVLTKWMQKTVCASVRNPPPEYGRAGQTL